MAQKQEGPRTINKKWIFLDTCSTHSVSNNPDLVTKIEQCDPDDFLTLTTNAGCRTFKQHARLKFLPMLVYYDVGSIGTILAMKDVANIPGVRVYMDTTIERTITVFLREGNKVQGV